LLKKFLTSAPILKITSSYEGFVLCKNACIEGIGGIFTQKNRVVCYEYQKLKEREINYATHDVELLDVVHGLKMRMNFLMGRIFELRTNHNGLKYLIDQPNLNARHGIW